MLMRMMDEALNSMRKKVQEGTKKIQDVEKQRDEISRQLLDSIMETEKVAALHFAVENELRVTAQRLKVEMRVSEFLFEDKKVRERKLMGLRGYHKFFKKTKKNSDNRLQSRLRRSEELRRKAMRAQWRAQGVRRHKERK